MLCVCSDCCWCNACEDDELKGKFEIHQLITRRGGIRWSRLGWTSAQEKPIICDAKNLGCGQDGDDNMKSYFQRLFNDFIYINVVFIGIASVCFCAAFCALQLNEYDYDFDIKLPNCYF